MSNLTSSKSSLALSVSALCLAVQVSAAVLHLSCNPPSNGNDKVADRPKLFANVSSQTVTNGAISSPTLYGKNTTQLAGEKGTLAGTIDTSTGALTVTGGGAGTTAIGQRSSELSVFK